MEPDISADRQAAIGRDDGEQPAAMEPMMPSESGPHYAGLVDRAFDLAAKANRLAGALAPAVRDALGDLVRSMNCYYSNLIEGHATHPVDIERALANDYSAEPAKRILQLEAVAHVTVQRAIDTGSLAEAPASLSAMRWIHGAFGRALPEELLWMQYDDGERVRVVPGALRDRYVKVGRHVTPSPGALPRFLARFDEAYAAAALGRPQRLIAAAAAHHRLLWIHPFTDGNGRVARLMSHAMLRAAGAGGALWSVARGLARRNADYKAALMAADAPRAGDLDGRGALSEAALGRFVAFFLDTAIDQVDFMDQLLEPQQLVDRIERWVAGEAAARRLNPLAARLLRAVLLTGSIERGGAESILGVGDRQTRRIAGELLDRRVLTSSSHRAPLRLAFPADVADVWFPRLFPPYRA